MRKQKITSGVVHDANINEDQINKVATDMVSELQRMKQIEPHNSGALDFCIGQVDRFRTLLLAQL